MDTAIRPLLSLEASVGLMLAMYAGSGVLKVVALGDTEVPRFQQKVRNLLGLELPDGLSQAIIFAAGIWEIAGVAAIARGMYVGNTRYVDRGANALVVFTVLATAIFYVGPNWKPMAFMANMTATAALLMISPAARDKYDEGDRPPPLFF